MSIISIIPQITNFFKINLSKPFIIYEIDALTATTPAELEQYIAIAFDAVYNYGYRNETKIPYQPLENGAYTTDSVLDNPFTLRATGAITMAFDNSVVSDYSSIEDVTDNLLYYLQSLDQVAIIKTQPFFTTYSPMHLVSFEYEVSPDNITLYADMTFQEVRSASEGSITPGQSTLNNGKTVSNPTNTNIQDGGIVAPNSNPTTSSTLKAS